MASNTYSHFLWIIVFNTGKDGRDGRDGTSTGKVGQFSSDFVKNKS